MSELETKGPTNTAYSTLMADIDKLVDELHLAVSNLVSVKSSPTSSPWSKLPWWRGIRGLIRSLYYGNHKNNPDYQDYGINPNESVKERLSLSEYLEITKEIEKAIAETLSSVCSSEILTEETNPELQSLFINFAQKLKQRVASYLVLMRNSERPPMPKTEPTPPKAVEPEPKANHSSPVVEPTPEPEQEPVEKDLKDLEDLSALVPNRSEFVTTKNTFKKQPNTYQNVLDLLKDYNIDPTDVDKVASMFKVKQSSAEDFVKWYQEDGQIASTRDLIGHQPHHSLLDDIHAGKITSEKDIADFLSKS